MTNLQAALAALHTQQLYRTRRLRSGAPTVRTTIDGRSYLTFCSNDYLGLAAHPTLTAALQEGAHRYGVGASASALITGYSSAHHQLEEALAEFLGRPRVLLFASGYLANLGILSALMGRNDTIFADRLNHASLIDGARLSCARLRRYPHNNVTALAKLLAVSRSQHSRTLLATDGVFSMDGDIAPLPALARLAAEQSAWLLVDDAHGIGVLGPSGAGSVAQFGLTSEQVPILVGTLGKAFGTSGAFVAGDVALIETLIQRARSYIYTTALPPALAHASLTALALVQSGHERRQQLTALINRFRHGATALHLPLLSSPTPIQPLLAGSAARAVAWSRHLERHGILVSAIRPPTVPVGTARLRVSLSAAHSAADVDQLLDALTDLPRGNGDGTE